MGMREKLDAFVEEFGGEPMPFHDAFVQAAENGATPVLLLFVDAGGCDWITAAMVAPVRSYAPGHEDADDMALDSEEFQKMGLRLSGMSVVEM